VSEAEDTPEHPKEGEAPRVDPEAPPEPPEGMVEDAPPGADEDESDFADEAGKIADEDNPELAKAKEKLRKIVENGRL
jgi:hypothetical protein